VDHACCARTRGAFVDVNNNIRIENFQESLEVACAQGCKEAIDDGSLLIHINVSCVSRSLNTAPCTAGELTSGFGGASDDGGDFVK
jgi:hypothetical protein